jgi:hypothetical protein
MTNIRVRAVVLEGHLVALQRGQLWLDTLWRGSVYHALPHSWMCVCEHLRRQLHGRSPPRLDLGHQMNRWKDFLHRIVSLPTRFANAEANFAQGLRLD